MRRPSASKESIAQTFVNKKCRGKSFGILILPGCVDKSMPNPSVVKNIAITTTYSGYGYLVEATGVEPVSENPSGKLSTSVAYLLLSLGRRGQARSIP